MYLLDGSERSANEFNKGKENDKFVEECQLTLATTHASLLLSWKVMTVTRMGINTICLGKTSLGIEMLDELVYQESMSGSKRLGS